MPYHEVSGITLHVFQDGGQMVDRLFVDQVKWKEPLILSLNFDK